MQHNLGLELHVQNYVFLLHFPQLWLVYKKRKNQTVSNMSLCTVIFSYVCRLTIGIFLLWNRIMQFYVFRTGDTCKKCNERKAEVILRFRDAYCRHVFILPRTLACCLAVGNFTWFVGETYWTILTTVMLSLQGMFLSSNNSQIQSFSW